MLVLLLCAGARRRAARGRVITVKACTYVVHMGACSLVVRGYLSLTLRCTGDRCFGYVFFCFMAVILLIAYGDCHSVRMFNAITTSYCY